VAYNGSTASAVSTQPPGRPALSPTTRVSWSPTTSPTSRSPCSNEHIHHRRHVSGLAAGQQVTLTITTAIRLSSTPTDPSLRNCRALQRQLRRHVGTQPIAQTCAVADDGTGSGHCHAQRHQCHRHLQLRPGSPIPLRAQPGRGLVAWGSARNFRSRRPRGPFDYLAEEPDAKAPASDAAGTRAVDRNASHRYGFDPGKRVPGHRLGVRTPRHPPR